MKKLLSSLFLITVLLSLSACENKWDHSDPTMPAEVRDQHQGNLDTNLESLKSNPQDTEALLNVAFEYQFLGDYKSAVDYYDQILAIDPNDEVSLNNTADIYEQMGDYDQAADAIRKLYVVKEDNAEVIKDTVRILLEDGEPAQAQQALENFARKNQSNTDAAQTISDLYQSILDYGVAHPQQQ